MNTFPSNELFCLKNSRITDENCPRPHSLQNRSQGGKKLRTLKCSLVRSAMQVLFYIKSKLKQKLDKKGYFSLPLSHNSLHNPCKHQRPMHLLAGLGGENPLHQQALLMIPREGVVCCPSGVYSTLATAGRKGNERKIQDNALWECGRSKPSFLTCGIWRSINRSWFLGGWIRWQQEEIRVSPSPNREHRMSKAMGKSKS